MRRDAAALEAQVEAAQAGLAGARAQLVDARSDHVAELEQLTASHAKKFASTKRKCEQLEASAVQAAQAMKQSDDNLKTVAKVRQLRRCFGGHFECSSPPYDTPQAPCDILYVVPMLLGC